jgi:hypothetical protein
VGEAETMKRKADENSKRIRDDLLNLGKFADN